MNPLRCTHGHPTHLCVRCDPEFPKDATEAELDGWQRDVLALNNRKSTEPRGMPAVVVPLRKQA